MNDNPMTVGELRNLLDRVGEDCNDLPLVVHQGFNTFPVIGAWAQARDGDRLVLQKNAKQVELGFQIYNRGV